MTQELRATLDSLLPQYPYGIPETKVQSLILVSDEEVTASSKKLLRVALEKGLGISFDQVQCFDIPAFSRDCSSTESVIAFGPKAREVVVNQGISQALICEPLSKVLSDPNEKKKFWANLKQFRQRLEIL